MAIFENLDNDETIERQLKAMKGETELQVVVPDLLDEQDIVSRALASIEGTKAIAAAETEASEKEARLERMEGSALKLYEEVLRDPTYRAQDRISVANKVLEIRGYVKGKGGQGEGNTFVFSDGAAKAFIDGIQGLKGLRSVN